MYSILKPSRNSTLANKIPRVDGLEIFSDYPLIEKRGRVETISMNNAALKSLTPLSSTQVERFSSFINFPQESVASTPMNYAISIYASAECRRLLLFMKTKGNARVVRNS